MLLLFWLLVVRHNCCFGRCFNFGVIVCMMLLLFLSLIQFCWWCFCDALDVFVFSLFQFLCCHLCNALTVLVIVCVMLSLLFVVFILLCCSTSPPPIINRCNRYYSAARSFLDFYFFAVADLLLFLFSGAMLL